MVNLRSEIGRFGLIVRVGGMQPRPGLTAAWMRQTKAAASLYVNLGKSKSVLGRAGHGQRETEILVEQQPPQGVLVCDQAGLVIDKFSKKCEYDGVEPCLQRWKRASEWCENEGAGRRLSGRPAAWESATFCGMPTATPSDEYVVSPLAASSAHRTGH